MKNNLFLILFVSSINMVAAQANWKLVYENDENGKAIFGTLEDLTSAIREGKSIRIYFIMGKGNTYVEHTAVAQMTTIMNSPNGKFVSAQIKPIAGQIPDFENGTLTLKENLEWSMIASSNGRNDQMTRNVINGEIVDHSIRKWGTKWFIEK